MDKYIITEIRTISAANKAQEFLFKRLNGMLYKTIADDTDLKRFRQALEETIQEAHKLAPKCLQMSLCASEEDKYVPGINFYFSVKNKWNGGIGSLRVNKIQGNWNS